MPKLTFIYIILETNRINHTALYKEAKNHNDFDDENFKRSYFNRNIYGEWNSKSMDLQVNGNKNKSSREHDEVLSKTISLSKFKKKTKKDSQRFLCFYSKIFKGTSNKNKESNETEIRISFEKFLKHYERFSQDEVKIQSINNINSIYV